MYILEHDRLVHMAMNNLRLSANSRKVHEAATNYNIDNDPVIELVNGIINEAVSRRASDIHFEPVEDGLRCRLRIDGQLQGLHDALPAQLRSFIISRLKVMCSMDIAEHRLPQDGRFIYPTLHGDIDVRVSIIPLISGEKAVLRLLNNSQHFMSVDDIGFSDNNKKIFLDLIHASNGAIIIAGPVNSGKTTTLYAALHELATGNENIMTIEDPVEYHMDGINQLQVNNKTGLTFASGLRASLRQDTDLIMLGETRDEETASMAIRAALTGHLLFTTLHTSSAAEGIFRLLDMGIKGYMLSAAIRGVVAQRLVRRLCPKCRQGYTVKEGSDTALFLGKYFHNGMKLYRSVGCNACDFTGYKGRAAIHEVMLLNDKLGEVIKQEEVSVQDIIDVSRENGMKELWQDGLEKANQGLTSLEELCKVLNSEGGL